MNMVAEALSTPRKKRVMAKENFVPQQTNLIWFSLRFFHMVNSPTSSSSGPQGHGKQYLALVLPHKYLFCSDTTNNVPTNNETTAITVNQLPLIDFSQCSISIPLENVRKKFF